MSLFKKKLAFMSIVNQVKGFVRNIVGIPPLTLPNAVGENLLDYKIYGESKQNGTPSPEAPVEIESVGEKTVNLFDKNNVEFIQSYFNRATTVFSNYPNGRTIYIPCKSNTTYVISRTENNSYNQFHVGYTDELPAIGVTVTFCGGDATGTVKNITFTTGNNSKYIVAYVWATHNTTMSFEEVCASLQIQEGAEATAYEPFGYKIPVKVCGKNLYNAEEHFNAICESETMVGYEPIKGVVDGVECYQYWGRNFSRQSDYSVSRTGSGLFKKNTQYTISFDAYDIFYTNPTTGAVMNGITLSFFYTDGTKSILNFNTVNKTEKIWKHWSASSNENKTIDYIHWIYATGAAQTYLANMQIEEGTIETEYEPYKDLGTTNIYLDEPLRKIDYCADYVDLENEKVVRRVFENVFKGTESWEFWKNASNECITYVVRGIPPIMSIGYKVIRSNMFAYSDNYEENTILSYTFDTQKGWISVTVSEEEFPTATDFKNFLSTKYSEGNPLKAYLQMPNEEIPIPLPNIPTAKGTTTLIADTTTQPSNMEVTYYSSI